MELSGALSAPSSPESPTRLVLYTDIIGYNYTSPKILELEIPFLYKKLTDILSKKLQINVKKSDYEGIRKHFIQHAKSRGIDLPDYVYLIIAYAHSL